MKKGFYCWSWLMGNPEKKGPKLLKHEFFIVFQFSEQQKINKNKKPSLDFIKGRSPKLFIHQYNKYFPDTWCLTLQVSLPRSQMLKVATKLFETYPNLSFYVVSIHQFPFLNFLENWTSSIPLVQYYLFLVVIPIRHDVISLIFPFSPLEQLS